MHGPMCVCIYIHIYKPVARCQTLEEQWQRAVMRRRSSATRNKEVVDVADATLSATTLLFGIPLFYETPCIRVIVTQVRLTTLPKKRGKISSIGITIDKSSFPPLLQRVDSFQMRIMSPVMQHLRLALPLASFLRRKSGKRERERSSIILSTKHVTRCKFSKLHEEGAIKN